MWYNLFWGKITNKEGKDMPKNVKKRHKAGFVGRLLWPFVYEDASWLSVACHNEQGGHVVYGR